MEILIIQTAFPGDLFLSLPLLKQTRRYFPQSKINLLCRKGLGEVFVQEKLVDRLFEIQKGHASSYKDALTDLKELKIDLVISPHRSVRTAFFIRSLRPKKSVGYKLWWNWPFFNSRLSYPRELPDALRQLKLLTLISEDFQKKWEAEENHLRGLLGSKDRPLVSFDDLDFPEWISGQLKEWKPEGNIICVAPGSVWPTKRWLPSSYSKLVRRLIDDGHEVYLVGASSDKKECEAVETAVPEVKNLCGKTSLLDLFALFQKSRLLISNDSGAMHVASAVGLPTLALFGPTVPEFGFRPWQKNARIVQTQLDCRPCSIHGTKKCPLGTHDCMNKLSVDQVYKEAIRLYNL